MIKINVSMLKPFLGDDKITASELMKLPVGISEKNLYNYHHIWKLKSWIDEDKLDFSGLSSNPRAMFMLEQNLQKIRWSSLSENPSGVYLLEKKQYLISWEWLSSNPSAIHLLKKNEDKINWLRLCANPNGIDLLKKNADKYDYTWWTFLIQNENAMGLIELKLDNIPWNYFGRNKSPRAIQLLEENPDKICWTNLSQNPSAIHLIEKYKHKINWYYLTDNEKAWHLIEKNLEDGIQYNEDGTEYVGGTKIDLLRLSLNPSAIHYLEKNQDRIYWPLFSSNEEIFEIDFDFLKRRMNIIRDELMTKAWHPDRFQEWCL